MLSMAVFRFSSLGLNTQASAARRQGVSFSTPVPTMSRAARQAHQTRSRGGKATDSRRNRSTCASFASSSSSTASTEALAGASSLVSNVTFPCANSLAAGSGGILVSLPKRPAMVRPLVDKHDAALERQHPVTLYGGHRALHVGFDIGLHSDHRAFHRDRHRVHLDRRAAALEFDGLCCAHGDLAGFYGNVHVPHLEGRVVVPRVDIRDVIALLDRLGIGAF